MLEIVEVAFKSVDMRFEIVDTHEGQAEELVVTLGHKRQLACRRNRVVGWVGAFADEFLACGTQFTSEEFSVIHG
ncbi:hypothetical protein [Halospeciosus flavus]|uniref:hypothetical protein n=1 Tax=Halospeciosus flavus TaxID=3032283 RepID=UPI0036D29737